MCRHTQRHNLSKQPHKWNWKNVNSIQFIWKRSGGSKSALRPIPLGGKIVLNLRDRKKESSRWLMWQLAVEEKTFHKRSIRKFRKPKEDRLSKTSLLTNFASRKIETFEKRSKNSCTRLHFYNQNISLAVQKSQWIKKAPQKDLAGQIHFQRVLSLSLSLSPSARTVLK